MYARRIQTHTTCDIFILLNKNVLITTIKAHRILTVWKSLKNTQKMSAKYTYYNQKNHKKKHKYKNDFKMT